MPCWIRPWTYNFWHAKLMSYNQAKGPQKTFFCRFGPLRSVFSIKTDWQQFSSISSDFLTWPFSWKCHDLNRDLLHAKHISYIELWPSNEPAVCFWGRQILPKHMCKRMLLNWGAILTKQRPIRSWEVIDGIALSSMVSVCSLGVLLDLGLLPVGDRSGAGHGEECLVSASAGSMTVSLPRWEWSSFGYSGFGHFPDHKLLHALLGTALKDVIEIEDGSKCLTSTDWWVLFVFIMGLPLLRELCYHLSADVLT